MQMLLTGGAGSWFTPRGYDGRTRARGRELSETRPVLHQDGPGEGLADSESEEAVEGSGVVPLRMREWNRA